MDLEGKKERKDIKKEKRKKTGRELNYQSFKCLTKMRRIQLKVIKYCKQKENGIEK